MKKKIAMLFLAATVSFAAFPQEDAASRLLKVLDDVLSAAVESGRASPSPGQEGVSFSLFNNTGFTVKSVFVSHSGSGEWGQNILYSSLYNGMSIMVIVDFLSSEGDTCNIRMVDVDGDYYTKYNVKIGDSSVIKITINDFEFER